jgi:hypothetical protein
VVSKGKPPTDISTVRRQAIVAVALTWDLRNAGIRGPSIEYSD